MDFGSRFSLPNPTSQKKKGVALGECNSRFTKESEAWLVELVRLDLSTQREYTSHKRQKLSLYALGRRHVSDVDWAS